MSNSGGSPFVGFSRGLYVAVLSLALSAGFLSAVESSTAARPSAKECLANAKVLPEIKRNTFYVRAVHRRTNSYVYSEDIRGKFEPLPEGCENRYRRELTYRRLVEKPFRNGAWFSTYKDWVFNELTLLNVPTAPDYDASFGILTSGMGYSDLYGYAAHHPSCIQQGSCFDSWSMASQRRSAWEIVRNRGLYICSNRHLRQPLLRSRPSSTGKTKVKDVFTLRVRDKRAKSWVASKSFTRRPRVQGAC